MSARRIYGNLCHGKFPVGERDGQPLRRPFVGGLIDPIYPSLGDKLA